jgi:hypothetical protein
MEAPITVVIKKNTLVSLSKEDLKSQSPTIFTDKTIVDNGKTLNIKLLPNQNGQFDITDLIKTEHLVANAEASKPIVQMGKNNREIAIEKIKFFFELPPFPDFENILNKIALSGSVRKIESKYVFRLSTLENQGFHYFDLSTLCYDIYEIGYKKGQSDLKDTYNKKEKAIITEQQKQKKILDKKNLKIVNLKKQITYLSGYSHLLYSFGFGASCVGLLWWLKSRAY